MKVPLYSTQVRDESPVVHFTAKAAAIRADRIGGFVDGPSKCFISHPTWWISGTTLKTQNRTELRDRLKWWAPTSLLPEDWER